MAGKPAFRKVSEITRLDLFIEYRLQMPVIAGFLVMRFLSGYTLVYTVF